MITEQEWLSAKTLIGLDLWRVAKGQHRKWRLFAAACCRRGIVLVADGRLEPVADAAERFADAEINWDEVKRVRKVLATMRREIDDQFGPKEALFDVIEALDCATRKKSVEALGADTKCQYAYNSQTRGLLNEGTAWTKAGRAEEAQQIRLARDIFGNPFRLIAFSPTWRTEHTVGIAAKMYDDRDFAAMPILSDALEEAGCDNADILIHCREPGVHVRGCWVVDLVLGKS